MPDAPIITERDRQIMAALSDPKEGAAIDPFEYAEWVQRPEIQRALDAHDDIKARNDQAIARQFRDELIADTRLALATLKANIRDTERLRPPEDGKEPPTPEQLRAQAESRRAAAHIIRIATRYLCPASHFGGSAGTTRGMPRTRGAPSRSGAPRTSVTHDPHDESRDPAAHTHRLIRRGEAALASTQDTRHGGLPTRCNESPSHRLTDSPAHPPPTPAPLPVARPDPDLTPEQATDLILQALRDNDNPHPDAGIATAYAFNHDANKEPRDWDQYKDAFIQRDAPVLLAHESAVIHPAILRTDVTIRFAEVPVEIHHRDGAHHRIRIRFLRGVHNWDGPYWRYTGFNRLDSS